MLNWPHWPKTWQKYVKTRVKTGPWCWFVPLFKEAKKRPTLDNPPQCLRRAQGELWKSRVWVPGHPCHSLPQLGPLQGEDQLRLSGVDGGPLAHLASPSKSYLIRKVQTDWPQSKMMNKPVKRLEPQHARNLAGGFVCWHGWLRTSDVFLAFYELWPTFLFGGCPLQGENL